MATIKVNSETMRSKAQTLKEIAESIKTYTEEMLERMTNLKSSYTGDAADALINRFRELSDDFEERYKTIISYSDFLNKAADEYDRVNSESVSDAQSLDVDA